MTSITLKQNVFSFFIVRLIKKGKLKGKKVRNFVSHCILCKISEQELKGILGKEEMHTITEDKYSLRICLTKLKQGH